MRALVLVAVGVLVGLARTSGATQSFQSGLECQRAQYGGGVSVPMFDEYGLAVFTGDPMTVSCPIVWMGSGVTITSATVTRVTYRDYSAGPSSATSVNCNTVTQDLYGNTFVGVTKFSCSTPGGCGSHVDYSNTGGIVDTLSLLGLNGTWVTYAMRCQIPTSNSRLVAYTTTY